MRLLEQFPPKADPPLAGASASALGAEGRGFESHQPDHIKTLDRPEFCVSIYFIDAFRLLPQKHD